MQAHFGRAPWRPPSPLAGWRFYALLGCLTALTLGFVNSAEGHFKLNVNIRVVHVEHRDDGLRILMRLPMALVVAGLLGPERDDGSRTPAPYSINEIEDGVLMHRLDVDALRRDPLGLGRLVAESHNFIADGKWLEAEVEAVVAHPALQQPPFATLDEATRALKGPAYAPEYPVGYVGDTVVDVALRYRGSAVYAYSFGSSLDPGLAGQEALANLLLDYFPGETKVFRATGLLHEPIEISRSALAAALTFVREGVGHILAGLDHVLFVICLALGATGFGALLWRATGFTLGHSVTLALGFFGFVPSGNWFVPLIETGIALSIIYAAIIALGERQQAGSFLVTTLIGLLHGLGFSFVLHEILRVEAPNVWQSLLSFNLGVELGQVAIIAVAWPLFRLLARISDRLWTIGRWAMAVPCIAVAALWAGQRLVLLVQAI